MKKSKNTRLLLLLVAIVLCPLKSSGQLSEIKTENGLVSGYKSGDISIFKGIPFAQPPVGDLRWKAPQPAKNWTGVLKCDKFSASPMQGKPVPFMMWTEEFITPPEKLSEDCLYLNYQYLSGFTEVDFHRVLLHVPCMTVKKCQRKE
jgi:para-nitrobenzyl esterase